MAIRNLRFEEDSLLRKKSKPVKEITENIIILLDDMVETMKSKEGLGLAAPQVGVLKRIVIIDIQDGEGIKELINPEIVETSGTQNRIEGCLSIPGKTGIVDRPAFVKVKATDRDGNEFFIEGEELLAVALCHELDHLDGVLYIDKVIEMVDEDDDYDDDDFEDEMG